jgi:hypothetical protein
MNHIHGNYRNQIRMPSLEQMVEPESMVRSITKLETCPL